MASKIARVILIEFEGFVRCDVKLPDLGLSLEDRIMLVEKVNTVFHVAVTVTFKQPLDDAVNTNTKGTSGVIDLCKELKQIISFIYVSTSYNNGYLSEIEEKVYTTSWELCTVINICDKQDKNSIALLEESILKTHPNTYSFSKNLADQIVFNHCKSFPSAVVRPSIIGASLKKPCPDWVDNVYGPTGVGLQIGKGNAKVLRAKRDTRLNLVSVDYVIDTILCGIISAQEDKAFAGEQDHASQHQFYCTFIITISGSKVRNMERTLNINLGNLSEDSLHQQSAIATTAIDGSRKSENAGSAAVGD
ncbi:hypothetical protein WN51_07405 [Melipona quadrifasciata]|uniref:Fatty acyl-CoA reductase n=1 Tax=Melipona quadrifasciata TaxID=166423 RepID=A0A0M8ZSG7_9HYME|nr:hypothetical protein WN51_07405 [Melipona quadrifasciata]